MKKPEEKMVGSGRSFVSSFSGSLRRGDTNSMRPFSFPVLFQSGEKYKGEFSDPRGFGVPFSTGLASITSSLKIGCVDRADSSMEFYSSGEKTFV